ncbi:fumarylacetoacetate hydrolase [Trichoderma velutinum]
MTGRTRIQKEARSLWWLTPQGYEQNWTRLIRFIAEEDNQVHLGQIDPSILKANLVIGSAFDGKVSNKILTIKQHEVPIIRRLGLNYRDHATEANVPVPNEPILFIKPGHLLARHIPPRLTCQEIAQKHVLGYTCSNDISCRSQQFKNGQWSFSKGFDGSAPIGPVLVRPNVIGDPSILDIQGIYNGTIVQSSNTRELIFGINKIISFLLQGTTLERGTVVMTGTGPEIGNLGSPKLVLQHGDDMKVHIEKIGTLINKVYYE